MIELLGVGISRREHGWLLHRVCVTLEPGNLTMVLSADVEERRALLDAIAGSRLPEQGRVWIDRLPLMPDTLGRARQLCGDIDPNDGLRPRRSVFWNTLAPDRRLRALGCLLRLPRRRERDAAQAALERVGLGARSGQQVAALSAFDRLRLRVARALARRPRYLVVRDPDRALSTEETAVLLGLLRMVARSDRVGVVVSLAEGRAGRGAADQVLLLEQGRLLRERHVVSQRRPTVPDIHPGA